jgi:hypothetical protein
MHTTNAGASTRNATLPAGYGEPMKRIAAVRAEAAASASAKKTVSVYTDAPRPLSGFRRPTASRPSSH